MKITTNQCIYVIHNPMLNIVKIGITDNLTTRKNSLEGACGCKLAVAYNTHYLIDAVRYENIAHGILAEHRGIGEWFNVTPEQAIEAVKTAVKEAKLDSILLAYRDGVSISQIAKDNSVTRQAIIWRLRHYGVYKEDNIVQNIEPPKPAPTHTTTHNEFLDGEEPINKERNMKRIEPNIFSDGEWYKANKYSNGTFHYAYSRSIDKARQYISAIAV